ncbi:MAG: hypothetical protein JWP52_919 [Rhizobacter sp.]|nr:hypothetical protein [Rhizobacter sp.]
MLAAASLAHAQPASAPAASSPAKKELVARLLALQQPALDNMSRNLAEQPARQMLASAEQVLQNRIAADKREAVGKQIQADVRKYLDEVVPILNAQAQKIAQSQIAPALDERFTEDELKQLVSFLESPVSKKYQAAMPELSAQMIQKLVTDARPAVDPKVQGLERSIASSLGIQPPSAAASGARPSAPSAPAPAASKATR